MKEAAFLAFTERGAALARKLSGSLGGSVTLARETADFSLFIWTREHFSGAEALIFIGAAGIAVRAVSPFLESKLSDPAVLCLDEHGRFVIPLVSGHLGGANALAERIASLCGATAVITTATDVNGLFAVDSWARKQGLRLLAPQRVKPLASRLLDGSSLGIYSVFPICGALPPGLHLCDAEAADIRVELRRRENEALCLVPSVLTLGLGCKRGATVEQFESCFHALLDRTGLCPEAVRDAASLDRKSDEPGLLAFCARHGWTPRFFGAEELRKVEGSFTASPFVESTVGVDNVCERTAVLASGGTLYAEKLVLDGVTMALALRAPELDWSW